jgi:hypothetical protein
LPSIAHESPNRQAAPSMQPALLRKDLYCSSGHCDDLRFYLAEFFLHLLLNVRAIVEFCCQRKFQCGVALTTTVEDVLARPALLAQIAKGLSLLWAKEQATATTLGSDLRSGTRKMQKLAALSPEGMHYPPGG